MRKYHDMSIWARIERTALWIARWARAHRRITEPV